MISPTSRSIDIWYGRVHIKAITIVVYYFKNQFPIFSPIFRTLGILQRIVAMGLEFGVWKGIPEPFNGRDACIFFRVEDSIWVSFYFLLC